MNTMHLGSAQEIIDVQRQGQKEGLIAGAVLMAGVFVLSRRVRWLVHERIGASVSFRKDEAQD